PGGGGQRAEGDRHAADRPGGQRGEANDRAGGQAEGGPGRPRPAHPHPPAPGYQATRLNAARPPGGWPRGPASAPTPCYAAKRSAAHLANDDEVGDPEAAQRTLLQGVHRVAEQAPQPAPARPVVQPREDVGFGNDRDVEPVEELQDAPGGVDPGVGAEDVADAGREVIDERQQAEEIALADEEPVSFERVEPVGRVDDDVPTGRQAAIGLLDRHPVVVDVLDNLIQEDHGEGAVGEGELLRGGDVQVRERLAGLRDLLLVDVDAIDLVAELPEARHVHAQATADVQDARALQGDVLPDLGQAAVLAA